MKCTREGGGGEDTGEIKIGEEREWRQERAGVKYCHSLYCVWWKG